MQSEFGPRIRPEEVTPEIRSRLVRASYANEAFAIACVLVPAVCISLLISLGYRMHGEPRFIEWQPITPILATAVVILLGVVGWFYRERRFLAKAPAAAAEVRDIETSYDLTHTHRLIIRYKPATSDTAARAGEQVVTVAIETDLKGFNEDLREGDNIAIIYDPVHPDHVHVVEEEHHQP